MRRVAITSAVIGLAVVGLVAGLGALERTGGGERLERWWIDGPERDLGTLYSITGSIGPDVIRVDGQEIANMAKTQIEDNWSCSVDIEFMSPAADKVTGNTELDVWLQLTGLLGAELHYIETFEDEGVDYNRFSLLAVVGGFGEIGEYTTFVVPADGSMQSVSATLAIDAELHCTFDADPIGVDKAGVTHAKECLLEDEWQIPEEQVGYAAIGSIEDSKVLTTNIFPTEAFSWQANFHLPEVTGDVVRFANIRFNGAAIDASELGPTALSPGTGTGEVWVDGTGNTVRYYFEDENEGFYGVGESTASPRHYSFGGLEIIDMDGNDIPALEVWCSAVQVYDAESGQWQLIKQSVSDWRGSEYADSWGYYSWDAGTPPDGAVRCLANVYFWIDQDSAQAHGLGGFTTTDPVSGRSFEHDARVIINGWPINKPDREADPIDETIAAVAHRDHVGIYGPADAGQRALAHDDWVGGQNTTSPNAQGEFEVDGDPGSLTLELPNNYGSRLAAVPQQNFPEGMALPTLYLVHEAGYWRPFDGEENQDETLHSEPREAVFCWRGWPCLRIPVSVASDEHDPLVVTLKARTWTKSDNHLSDSTRPETFTASATEHTWTYPVFRIAAQNVAFLGMPEEGGGEPDLEDVYELTLSNIPPGEHEIAEPTLRPDPLSFEDDTVKFFEGWAYRHGGFSGVADHVCRYALMDSHEGNAGKANMFEATCRNFDFVQTPGNGGPPIDLSSAKTLASAVGHIEADADAWQGVYDEQAAEGATKDAHDNVLKVLSVTDVVPFAGRTVGAVPVAIRCAEWTAVRGLAYNWNALKIVEGAINGSAEDGGNPAREDSGPRVVRREGSEGEWEQFAVPSTDTAGYWRTPSGEIYADVDPNTLWIYGMGAEGEEEAIGRLATREYRYALIDLDPGQTEPNLCLGPDGRCWLVFREGQRIRCRVMESPQRGWNDRSSDVFEAEGYTWPRVAAMSDGTLIVVATNPEEDGSTVRRSHDDGTTWVDV